MVDPNSAASWIELPSETLGHGDRAVLRVGETQELLGWLSSPDSEPLRGWLSSGGSLSIDRPPPNKNPRPATT